MIPYQKEKIDNAICYFAKEYKTKARRYLPQTMLYKLLAFLDMESVKEIGMPVLGLDYLAMERGPVPPEIYNKKQETALYKFVPVGDKKYDVICKGKPNLDYFSDYELEKMERLIFIHANAAVNTKLTSQASHDELPAWKKAYKKKPDSKIDFEDMFEENLKDKSPEKLSAAEEHFLIQKAILGHR